ncbi:YoaK family protein [Microbacterium tumbae]
MLALTFTTGIVDAVGYLGLDRVFTGNMTGNVVILGMALAGGDDLPVIGPVIALAAFLLGAVIGGRTLRGIGAGWERRTTVLFLGVGVILLAASALLLATEPRSPGPLLWSVTAALGLAMGAQAATARNLAVKDVTTVVVTSTLTGLAADSRLGGGQGQPWRRRAGAVVLIGLGALLGALLVHVHVAVGLLVAGGIVLAVALSGERGLREA